MKQNDLLILLLALALLLAMILTFIQGGERSRHGYGAQSPEPGISRAFSTSLFRGGTGTGLDKDMANPVGRGKQGTWKGEPESSGRTPYVKQPRGKNALVFQTWSA
jgi:hypothetical protein